LPYRPAYWLLNKRLNPALAAIIPASMLSAMTGMALLIVAMGLFEIVATNLPINSIGDAIILLAAGGMIFAFGSIGGTIVIAFYLTIFGLPVALILGERVRQPIGMAAASLSALVAGVAGGSWLWETSNLYGGQGSAPLALPFSFIAFGVPAAFLYRRQIINLRDEYAD
jgi:hypothetical protein